MECCFLRNVRGKMADRKTASHKKCGVTFDRLLIPNGAKVSYKPISCKDGWLLHLLDYKMLSGAFMGYVLRAGGGWFSDLLLADCEDLENLSASEIHVQSFKHQEVSQGRRSVVSMCGRENLRTV